MDILPTENQSNPKGSWAFYLALCLLSPLFFLSLVFSILSPLPTLYLHQGIPERIKARKWSVASVLVGCLICFSIKGWMGIAGFLILSSIPALLLGEILERTKSPEQAVAGAMAGVLLALAVGGYAYSEAKGVAIVPYVKTLLTQSVQHMTKRLLENQQQLGSNNINEDDLKKILDDPSVIVNDFPGILLSTILLLCILPLVAMIRWNPKGFGRRLGISRDFIRQWRSPEWLIWPSLFSGAFLLFEVPYLSILANNLLKPLLIIYFLQGMSILSYFLDSIRLGGPIRVVLYGLGTIFLTPMLISFGFFDLWFNFRRRNRDKNDEE